jgi:hypothetical protein
VSPSVPTLLRRHLPKETAGLAHTLDAFETTAGLDAVSALVKVIGAGLQRIMAVGLGLIVLGMPIVLQSLVTTDVVANAAVKPSIS